LERVIRKEYVADSIINRFLSLALLPMGVVGFWGTTADLDLLPMRQVDSLGEAFFVDIRGKKVYARGRNIDINHRLRVVKWSLESSHRMEIEELFAFLHINCALLDYPGSTFRSDRLIKELVTISYGEIVTKENRRPKINEYL
jgi:hypothetical protein